MKINTYELELLRGISHNKSEKEYHLYMAEKSTENISKAVEMCEEIGIHKDIISLVYSDKSRAGIDMILTKNDVKVVK